MIESQFTSPSVLDSQMDLRSASAKTGLRFLMAAISSMFFLFFISYIMRSQISDWEALAQPWQPLATTNQLWINSVFLVIASIALEGTRYELGKHDLGLSREFLWVAGAASLVFLAGQLSFWGFLSANGFYVQKNPANSFFYLLTGLHGLHLLGGLVALTVANYRLMMARRLRSNESTKLAKLSADLCAMYWHFLMALWLIVFALVSSSPSTYAAIAEFCGLSI